MPDTRAENFTPALGKHWLTPFYDLAVALTTRERAWRNALINLVAPEPDEHIVDIGCGTATLDIAALQKEPLAQLTGVDPDSNVLAIAARKTAQAGVTVKFIEDYGDALASHLPRNGVDKVFSGLMLHHVPTRTKLSIFKSAFTVLKPGGMIFIADFGEQKSWLAKALFKTIQTLDGFDTTQPNAEGILPVLLQDAGFAQVREVKIFFTPVGTISLYSAQKSPGHNRRSKYEQYGTTFQP